MIKKMMLAVAVCLFVSQANAERNDVVLNVGIGYGLSNQSVSTWDVSNQPAASSTGVLGRVKVGVMTTPMDALFGFGQVARLSYDAQEAPVDAATLSVIGIGYSHYLRSEVGSPFFTLGVGFSRYQADGGADDLLNGGQSFLLETGYEVNEHLQLSSTLTMSRMADLDWESDSYSDVAIMSVTFNIEYKL